MQFAASKAFLHKQRNLFWMMTISFGVGSVGVLDVLHGYFLASFFQVLIVVQIVWFIIFFLITRKMIFAWNGLTVETFDNEMVISKAKNKTVIPYSSIAKIHIETRHNKITAIKIETSAPASASSSESSAEPSRIIVLRVSDPFSLYQILKTKVENPWKIAVDSFSPLQGVHKIAVPMLASIILLVVAFRAFMAFEALSMRPDLGITYESWLFLVFIEFGAAIALASQVIRRKWQAFAVALAIGLIFLYGILNAILFLSFDQAPHWYLITFWIYLGVLISGNLCAIFLLIKKPPLLFLTEDLGDKAERFT